MLTRLRDERGISLLLSLLVMSILSITTAGMIAYTSAGSRTSSIERSRVSSRAIAEAGLNNALAILNQALDPKTASLLAINPDGTKRTFTFQGGTAQVWGQYSGDDDDGLWTIWSTGTVPNPTGGAPLTRTLAQTVEVRGLIEGSTVSAWSRMHHDDPSASNCLDIEDVTIPVPVSSRGCINLRGTGKITGAATTVDAGTNVTLVGDSGTDPKVPASATGWGSDSSNVYSSNNSDADYTVSGTNPTSTSPYLDVTNFGFAIPATATVTGIRVEIERAGSSTSSAGLRDEDVRLIRSGVTAGVNKATTSTWGTSDATATYGNATTAPDDWGAGLTAAQVNGSTFGVRLRVRNLHTSSSRTASVDYVRITVAWTNPPASSIGASGQNIAVSQVAGTCKYGTQAASTPCSATDRVYATTYGTAPQELEKPTIDLDYWYEHAAPGPAQGCNNPGGSFPGGFDNNYNAANPNPDNSRNSSYGSAEVTPQNSSYTCTVTLNNKLVGEISWNHTTRVLRIKGTIYIDGDFRFDDDGTIAHYQGRGIIYATGNLEFDEMVCAGGSGSTSCFGTLVDGRGSTMSNWDPTQNMMTVLAHGWAEFDQGATQSPSTPSGLQGIVYSDGRCEVHQWFHLSGPIICGEIDLPSDSWGWPQYYPWPSLGSLVEGQQYGSVGDADDYALVPGNITG